MAILRIAIEWHDGTYHGAEWPPSPFRVFQALIAGYSVQRRGDLVCAAAMQHLEALPAPAITAPEAVRRKPVAVSVPHNDGDLVLESLARGAWEKARSRRAKGKTIRIRHPYGVTGAVSYDWQATVETADHAEVLAEIARSVTAVGQGIDAVMVRAEVVDQPSAMRGVRYEPSPAGRCRLSVPYRGAFADLEARYRQFRTRVDGGQVRAVRELQPPEAGYALEHDLPPIRCAVFALRDPNDGPFAWDGTRAMEIAAMVRHAIGTAARQLGLPEETVSELLGHRDARRIWIQPLPNVGHQHADGRIRRVLLTAPESVHEDSWTDVTERLAGRSLVPVGQQASAAILVPITARDRVSESYRGTARVWTTATPVVLPGYDRRRGKPRPDRALRRLLRHAGIAENQVESVTLEPAGRLAGSSPPARYRRPCHLARYPCQHMTITWTHCVTGPVALGAGIGYGLGLFLPASR